MHTKMHTNGGRAPQALQLQGFAWGAYRVRVPPLAPNISDLAPKTVRTNADKLRHEKLQTRKSLLLFTEMDASLVGAPDFKPARAALILS